MKDPILRKTNIKHQCSHKRDMEYPVQPVSYESFCVLYVTSTSFLSFRRNLSYVKSSQYKYPDFIGDYFKKFISALQKRSAIFLNENR